jgi:hypothetical protein
VKTAYVYVMYQPSDIARPVYCNKHSVNRIINCVEVSHKKYSLKEQVPNSMDVVGKQVKVS